MGNGMLSRYQIDMGPVLLNFVRDETKRHGIDTNWYVLPGSVIGIGWHISEGHEFSLEDTLQHGVLTFYSDDLGSMVGGEAFANSVVLTKGMGPEVKSSVRGHEYIHTLQYREMGSTDLLVESERCLGNFLERKHIKVGADIGAGTIMLSSYFIEDHDSRPVELVPEALELSRYSEE